MSHDDLDDELAGFGDNLASATRVTPGHALRPEDIALQDAPANDDIATYALWLGDDALILAQRLSWWISRAPEMEEDIALGNIALDTLGHARSFLTYAGKAWGKTEDDLAYFRDETEFCNVVLVEQPNGHFGTTIARQLVFSTYAELLYSALRESTDATIAAISAKALKEVAYHVDHATQWTLRLGLGTEESHAKMGEAFELIWPYVDEVFMDQPLHDDLAAAGVAIAPSGLRAEFDARIGAVLSEADLGEPSAKPAMVNGRAGQHSEHLGYILAEMQVLARKHPGVTW